MEKPSGYGPDIAGSNPAGSTNRVYVFYLVGIVKGTKSGQAAANCYNRGNQALFMGL